MRRLSQVAQGRDNNFNLIRLVAAVAVLVSHAAPLTQGRGTPEPLARLTGHTLGTLAVYVFFVASGFFVAGSLSRRGPAGFALARARRILPGLAVSLLLVTFVLGPAVTTRTLADYFAAPGTAAFLIRGLLPLDPLYTLPGVFADNPYPTVEGSIWTLAYEIACYAGLALTALAAGIGAGPGARSWRPGRWPGWRQGRRARPCRRGWPRCTTCRCPSCWGCWPGTCARGSCCPSACCWRWPRWRWPRRAGLRGFRR